MDCRAGGRVVKADAGQEGVAAPQGAGLHRSRRALAGWAQNCRDLHQADRARGSIGASVLSGEGKSSSRPGLRAAELMRRRHLSTLREKNEHTIMFRVREQSIQSCAVKFKGVFWSS
jgi:hypothetical protein